MTKCNSTPASKPNKPRTPQKPAKPSRRQPTYAYASGLWAKKIRVLVYYFGSWADPDGAVAAYNPKKEALP